MISFELKEGYSINRFFESLKLIALAESLGGVESLVCHPATMTHASIPRDIRERLVLQMGLSAFCWNRTWKGSCRRLRTGNPGGETMSLYDSMKDLIGNTPLSDWIIWDFQIRCRSMENWSFIILPEALRTGSGPI